MLRRWFCSCVVLRYFKITYYYVVLLTTQYYVAVLRTTYMLRITCTTATYILKYFVCDVKSKHLQVLGKNNNRKIEMSST
jgi:hypothetical protein